MMSSFMTKSVLLSLTVNSVKLPYSSKVLANNSIRLDKNRKFKVF